MSDHWGREAVFKRHPSRINASHDVVRMPLELAPANALCLEAGCGSGTYAIELSAGWSRCVGTDLSTEALRISRRRC